VNLRSLALVLGFVLSFWVGGWGVSAPIYYWSFNSGLGPDIGSGVTSVASYTGIGVGIEGFGPGTTVNAVSGYPAGDSLEFLDVVNVYSDAEFTVTGLDFSTISAPSVSFAFSTDHIFLAGERLRLFTNNGSGWVLRESFTVSSVSAWESFSSAVPSLAGVSSGGVRIRAEAVFDLGKYSRIDNLQVVPEPGVAVYLVFGLGLFLLYSAANFGRKVGGPFSFFRRERRRGKSYRGIPEDR